MVLRGLVRSLSFFVLGIIFTLNVSLQFSFVLLAILSIEIIILFIFIKLVFPVFKAIQEKLDHVNTIVLENVNGARVVKAFSKEKYENKRFRVTNDDYTNTNLYVSNISSLINPLLTLIVNVGQIIIYYLGGKKIIDFYLNFTGTETPDLLIDDITAAISYISMICMAIIMLGMLFTNLAKAFASMDRVNEVLDTEPNQSFGTLGKNDTTVHGKIEFKNVSFKYPEGKRDALSNISFETKPGESIAIVGATGSGKTTIVNLLLRFYDATTGMITIDGHDILKVSKRDLRDYISIVLQDPVLFGDTIENNIKYGKSDATDEEVDKALEFANCNHFVNQLKNGKKTMLSEGACNISQGQRQLLTIARAVIKNPKILILDEATSSVDTRTEKRIQDAMVRLMANRTSIIIAHRLSTIQDADLIVVLDNGVVVELGNHNELLEKNGVYKKLYETQFKGLNT